MGVEYPPFPIGGKSRIVTAQSLKAVAEPILARRIDVASGQLGFTDPPCPIQLKFFQMERGWVLVGLTPPGQPAAIARWLETYAPVRIQIAPGLSPKVLRATFDKLPPAWERLLTTVIVHYLELTPDGSASLFVEDSIKNVQHFVDELKQDDSATRVRRTLSGPERVRLTARQLEILSLAVALGYYEVPHRLSLRTLATRVGLSLGAVSELLRRGEALIIKSYVDEFSESQWGGSPGREGTQPTESDP